jgi:hypothetical protein
MRWLRQKCGRDGEKVNAWKLEMEAMYRGKNKIEVVIIT